MTPQPTSACLYCGHTKYDHTVMGETSACVRCDDIMPCPGYLAPKEVPEDNFGDLAPKDETREERAMVIVKKYLDGRLPFEQAMKQLGEIPPAPKTNGG